MRKHALAMALVLAALAGAASAALSPTAPSAFGLDSVWDDGKGEVVTYVTTKAGSPGYDTRILVHKTAIVVDPQRSFDALRMVMVRDVPSGSTTQRQRTAVLFLRKTLSPVEIWDSSGTRGMHARVWHSALEYTWRSEEGTRTVTQAWQRADIFYDALPVWLRGLDLTTPARDSVRMLPPNQLASLRGQPNAVMAEIQVVGPAGKPSETSRGGLEVAVRHAGKEDRLWFHPGPGHVLLVWEKSDGTTLTLRKNQRLAVDDKDWN